MDNTEMDLRKKWYGLYRSGSGYRLVEFSCEKSNEPSGSLNFWKGLQCLPNWQLLKKGSAP
jgi:hypothetical protein